MLLHRIAGDGAALRQKEERPIRVLSRRCVEPGVAELSAIWPSLKLIGERGLLLLRFRPRTVLPLVRNPEHALESAFVPLLSRRHQC